MDKFYFTSPPSCTEKIADYLKTSSLNIENGPAKFYRNETWIQMYRFRRAGVYINEYTDEHVFHDDESDWVTYGKKFLLWESFNTMIIGVSNLDAKLRKL
jgi:hypothetical protein